MCALLVAPAIVAGCGGSGLTADLDDADPRAPSLIPVYAGANWHEREAVEMFGVAIANDSATLQLQLQLDPARYEGNPW